MRVTYKPKLPPHDWPQISVFRRVNPRCGMSDKATLLQARTNRFALQVIRLRRQLPRCNESFVIGRQLLRSATSLAANYRAACRARSRPEFLVKLGTLVEEVDETVFWLELCSAQEWLVSRMTRDNYSRYSQHHNSP
jgi:four helix bundle protein